MNARRALKAKRDPRRCAFGEYDDREAWAIAVVANLEADRLNASGSSKKQPVRLSYTSAEEVFRRIEDVIAEIVKDAIARRI